MSLSNVGKVDIFAETGEDQWLLLQAAIRREIEKKKIKEGDRYFMPVFFDEPLVIEIKVTKSPQERLV